MAEIILVTGGARSGKSVFAEEKALSLGKNPCYIATAPVLDDEMRDRVARHKARRKAQNWTTVEEELDLEKAFASQPDAGVFLVDCLTLWISNLLYHDPDFRENDMFERTERLLQYLDTRTCKAVFVLNEVGLGIVPADPLTRTFRDCSGRCGQMIASRAKEVYFLVCGIPMKLKG